MIPTARLSAALTGRYEIERELGAGGMATVYLANDLRHGRRVAVKVVRPELSAVTGSSAPGFAHPSRMGRIGRISWMSSRPERMRGEGSCAGDLTAARRLGQHGDLDKVPR